MTKKTTTTKTTVTEKEVKTPEVKATTSTKATASTTSTKTTKKASTKMTKDELVKKAMADAKAKKEAKKPVEEKDISAEKEQELFDEVEKPAEKPKAKKPVKKAAITKKVQTKAKTPVFPEILKIENLGTLKKVTSEDYQELKAMENLAFVTVWNKKSVKYYDDSHTPGVKTSDLFTIGNWSYDVSTPIFFKENSEQVVTISNFTEACFIFGHANCFDILEDENGEGNFRNDYDLVFEIYQVVETEEQ